MIEAHITDSYGVYRWTEIVDEMGPQPAGAQYGDLPKPVQGKTPVWRDGWVLVADEDLPKPDQPLVTSDQLQTALTAEYESRMTIISTGYPPSERESWPVQTAEARALLDNPSANTPWIDTAAEARGIDRLVLAQRIVEKDYQYRLISGKLSGIRQRIEDQIDAAGEDQEKLKMIDVTSGWDL